MRHGGRALGAVLVLLAALLAWSGTAGSTAAADAADAGGSAAGAALELSPTGTTWSDSISAPLFDPEVRWVPGDVREASFLVRNVRADAGDLAVVVARSAREDLIDTGHLHLAARSGTGPWTEIAAGGRHELLTADDLVAGREVPVAVRLRLDGAAPNTTMLLGSDLDVEVVLTESAAGPGGSGPTTGPSPAPGDLLPDTGTGVRAWMLPLALLLLVAGTVLAAAGRRRAVPHPHRTVPARGEPS